MSKVWAFLWNRPTWERVFGGLLLLGITGAIRYLFDTDWKAVARWLLTPLQLQRLDVVLVLLLGAATGFVLRSGYRRARQWVADQKEQWERERTSKASASEPPGLNYDKLKAAYDSVPALQTGTVVAHHKGAPIRWECAFENAYERDNELIHVILSLADHPSHYASCTVRAGDYPALRLLRRGHPVVIVGVLGGFDGLDAEVWSAVLEFGL